MATPVAGGFASSILPVPISSTISGATVNSMDSSDPFAGLAETGNEVIAPVRFLPFLLSLDHGFFSD